MSCSANRSCAVVGVVQHMMTIFLIVEAILFGLFTLCMLSEQYYGFESGETTVERIIRLKGRQIDPSRTQTVRPVEEPNSGNKSVVVTEFVEIFGTAPDANESDLEGAISLANILHWLYPTPITFFSSELRDKLYGFTCDAPVVGRKCVPCAMNNCHSHQKYGSQQSMSPPPSADDSCCRAPGGGDGDSEYDPLLQEGGPVSVTSVGGSQVLMRQEHGVFGNANSHGDTRKREVDNSDISSKRDDENRALVDRRPHLTHGSAAAQSTKSEQPAESLNGTSNSSVFYRKRGHYSVL